MDERDKIVNLDEDLEDGDLFTIAGLTPGQQLEAEIEANSSSRVKMLSGKKKYGSEEQHEEGEQVDKIDKGSSKLGRFKRGKLSFKDKGASNMVTLDGGLPMEDVVILDNEKNARHSRIMRGFKLALMVVLLVFATSCVYFGMSYKMIDADVKGTETTFENFSVISRFYQPNTEELKGGETLIISKTPDWCPIVYSYETYTYLGRHGGIIYALNAEGLQTKLEQMEISYIMRD